MSPESIYALVIVFYLIASLVFSVLYFVNRSKLKRLLVRYSGIVDIEAEEKSMRKKMRKAFDLLKANLLGLRDDVDDVKSDYKAKHEKLQEL